MAILYFYIFSSWSKNRGINFVRKKLQFVVVEIFRYDVRFKQDPDPGFGKLSGSVSLTFRMFGEDLQNLPYTLLRHEPNFRFLAVNKFLPKTYLFVFKAETIVF